MTTAPERDDRVRRACERLIEDLKLTLPPHANLSALKYLDEPVAGG